MTPRYVHGFAAERELPIVAQIAKGSIRNKLLIILPIILLLSQFLPWLLTPILMLGGSYLAFEAVEKIMEKLTGVLGEDLAASKIDQKDLASRLADIDGLRDQIKSLTEAVARGHYTADRLLADIIELSEVHVTPHLRSLLSN